MLWRITIEAMVPRDWPGGDEIDRLHITMLKRAAWRNSPPEKWRIARGVLRSRTHRYVWRRDDFRKWAREMV